MYSCAAAKYFYAVDVVYVTGVLGRLVTADIVVHSAISASSFPSSVGSASVLS